MTQPGHDEDGDEGVIFRRDTERDSLFPRGNANPNWGGQFSVPRGETHAAIRDPIPEIKKFLVKNFTGFCAIVLLIYNR